MFGAVAATPNHHAAASDAIAAPLAWRAATLVVRLECWWRCGRAGVFSAHDLGADATAAPGPDSVRHEGRSHARESTVPARSALRCRLRQGARDTPGQKNRYVPRRRQNDQEAVEKAHVLPGSASPAGVYVA